MFSEYVVVSLQNQDAQIFYQIVLGTQHLLILAERLFNQLRGGKKKETGRCGKEEGLLADKLGA